jgi:hypothetical protein
VVVSRLLFGSLETKRHSNVGVAERHTEYYVGEGGGCPRVWAVVSFVSLMSPKSLVACPSTKGAPKNVLTNLLVDLMQIRVSN